MGCKKSTLEKVNVAGRKSTKKVNVRSKGNEKSQRWSTPEVNGQQKSQRKSTINAWSKSKVLGLTWQADVALGLTDWAKVTSAWARGEKLDGGRFFEQCMRARLAADWDDFCTVESSFPRSFQWQWRCHD